MVVVSHGTYADSVEEAKMTRHQFHSICYGMPSVNSWRAIRRRLCSINAIFCHVGTLMPETHQFVHGSVLELC